MRALFLTFSKSLVRPHLEYCSPVWNTNLKGFSKNIEKIQKSATRIVPSLKNLSYFERLKKLNLASLEFRRLREDIVSQYKIC